MTQEQTFGAQETAMHELHAVTQEYAANGVYEAKALAGLMLTPCMLVAGTLVEQSVGWGFIALSAGTPLLMVLWGFLAGHTLPLGTVIPAAKGSVGVGRFVYFVGVLGSAIWMFGLGRHHDLSLLGMCAALVVFVAAVVLGLRGAASRSPELLVMGGAFCFMARLPLSAGGPEVLWWRGILLVVGVGSAVVIILCRVKLRSLHLRMSALRGAMMEGGSHE